MVKIMNYCMMIRYRISVFDNLSKRLIVTVLILLDLKSPTILAVGFW